MNENLAEQILRRIRKALDVENNKELSTKIGISRNTIYSWVDRNKVSNEKIRKVCRDLKLDIEYILTGEKQDQSETISEEIMENENPIASRLRKFRTDNSWSEDELARRLNTEQAYVHRYETGTKIPHTFLIEFNKVFPDKFYWLLTGENQKNEVSSSNGRSAESEWRDKYLRIEGKMEALKDQIDDLKKEKMDLIDRFCGEELSRADSGLKKKAV